MNQKVKKGNKEITPEILPVGVQEENRANVRKYLKKMWNDFF